MVIHLLRHTQPKIDKGICYGHTDIDVEDSFNKEVKSILDSIENQKFDIIYSSPLKRCVKLAERVLHNHEKIIYDHRLKELNFGEWELKKWDEIIESEVGKAWFDDYLIKTCPGGESYPELEKRIEIFIEDIKSSNSNDRILVVTHAGVIRVFYKLIAEMSMDDAFKMSINYGELFTIEL